MKIFINLIFIIFLCSSCHQSPSHQSKSIWKPYSKQAIEDAVVHHKPVVIDFWAEWCPNCYELDREVFSLPQVQAQLAQVTALKMDVTNQSDPEVQKIIQQYELDGVPTIIFLDANGKEVNNSRLIGFVTPKEFLQIFTLLKISK